MSEESFISVRFACPQCGHQLVGPSGKDEAQLSDIVRCPVHGNIARFDELAEKATKEVRTLAEDQFAQIFKDAGFSITKK